MLYPDIVKLIKDFRPPWWIEEEIEVDDIAHEDSPFNVDQNIDGHERALTARLAGLHENEIER